MNHIINIIQALEDSNILLKGVNKTIKNETREWKGGFWFGFWSGFGNKKVKGIVRAGSRKKMRFLMLPHPLTNFEMQKY